MDSFKLFQQAPFHLLTLGVSTGEGLLNRWPPRYACIAPLVHEGLSLGFPLPAQRRQIGLKVRNVSPGGSFPDERQDRPRPPYPGRIDSPLRGDVLFSRAWHTANRIPVGEVERMS